MDSTANLAKGRIYAIDTLRGIIMVIMALDHVRDFFTNVHYDPLDLTKTSAMLFLTRWITHFCAPTFVFLSGVSANLSLSKRNDKREASLFMIKRGLMLILMDVTIICFGFMVDPEFHTKTLQVFWAIGCSMIVLAGLIHFKPVYIALFGLILIFGHNALDSIHAVTFVNFRLLWMLLHESGFYHGKSLIVIYPIIPWIGVMAVGYVFGNFFKLDARSRKALFIKIGLACLGLLLILRGFNIYGDPVEWHTQDIWWKSIFSFINFYKYPPSLSYLLATIGVSILSLAFLDNINNKLTRIFTVYGRVPMFYYIAHIYLGHGIQLIFAFLGGYQMKDFFRGIFVGYDPSFGYGLPVVYLVWIFVVVALYLPCKWFMKIKQTRTDQWLRYF